MAKRVNKKTKRITVGALSIALGVVILALGSLIDVLDLSAAALAGMIAIFSVIEMGGAWPWMIYAGTGVLSLFLPRKLPAVFYILIAGWYPIVKEKIEMIRSRVIQWVIKIAIVNIALVITALVSKYVLALPDDGMLIEVALLVLSNFCFVLYDVALTRLIGAYIFKIRQKLKINKL